MFSSPSSINTSCSSSVFYDKETNTDAALTPAVKCSSIFNPRRYFNMRRIKKVCTYLLHCLIIIPFKWLVLLTRRVILLDNKMVGIRYLGNKMVNLLAICLASLFILAGLWLFMDMVFSENYLYSTSLDTASTEEVNTEIITDNSIIQLIEEKFLKMVQGGNLHSVCDGKSVCTASVQKLSKDDLEHIVNDVRNLLSMEKLSTEPTSDFINEIKRLQSRLMCELNHCCKKSIVNAKKDVSIVIHNILNDEEYLRKTFFYNYLHNDFIKKRDVESLVLSHVEKTDQTNNKLAWTDGIVNEIKNDLHKEIEKIKAEIAVGFLSVKEIERIVKDVLKIYDADKTGLVDYAMESMGGQILTIRCTEKYRYGKSPRAIITPKSHVGDCWAFQNFPGHIVIQLANVVEIEAFSMEHISKLLIPNGKIDSAPREFVVYGLKSENDKEFVTLGHYIYDYLGEPLQFFKVQNPGQVFRIIELKIISNHGNPNYTCLYRFRVHGKLK